MQEIFLEYCKIFYEYFFLTKIFHEIFFPTNMFIGNFNSNRFIYCFLKLTLSFEYQCMNKMKASYSVNSYLRIKFICSDVEKINEIKSNRQ